MLYSRASFLKLLGLSSGAALSRTSPGLAKMVHQPILKPKKLQRGDTIGLISPASSLEEEKEYEEVAQKFHRLGFNTKIGPHAKDHYGYLAGADRARAADLNAMFTDSEVNAIIPFRGGWGCNRILELIDFEAIKSHPKPLIGYSDITSLLLSIYAKTGLITYHGPVGTTKWTPFTSKYFHQTVMTSSAYTLSNTSGGDDSSASVTTIFDGQARGRLLGGNLSVLAAMLGSDYLPDWRHSILFIEDVGEDIYRIDRMLTQLELNGIFDQINGLIFGKCTKCDVDTGYHFTLNEILEDHLKPYQKPVFAGAQIGHIENMFTLPVGIMAEINAGTGTIRLLENPTQAVH